MSEHQQTPVKKQTRSCKLTKEKSQEIIRQISMELQRHVGQPAILFVKDGREMVPYLVELTNKGEAQYKCYAPDGTFRCFLKKYPNAIDIMVGDQKIVYFDDGI